MSLSNPNYIARGYTRHGWPMPGRKQDDFPPPRNECAGPGECEVCTLDAAGGLSVRKGPKQGEAIIDQSADPLDPNALPWPADQALKATRDAIDQSGGTRQSPEVQGARLIAQALLASAEVMREFSHNMARLADAMEPTDAEVEALDPWEQAPGDVFEMPSCPEPNCDREDEHEHEGGFIIRRVSLTVPEPPVAPETPPLPDTREKAMAALKKYPQLKAFWDHPRDAPSTLGWTWGKTSGGAVMWARRWYYDGENYKSQLEYDITGIPMSSPQRAEAHKDFEHLWSAFCRAAPRGVESSVGSATPSGLSGLVRSNLT